jgi:hypothetical protein
MEFLIQRRDGMDVAAFHKPEVGVVLARDGGDQFIPAVREQPLCLLRVVGIVPDDAGCDFQC